MLQAAVGFLHPHSRAVRSDVAAAARHQAWAQPVSLGITNLGGFKMYVLWFHVVADLHICIRQLMPAATYGTICYLTTCVFCCSYSLSYFTTGKNSRTEILQPGLHLSLDTHKASACFCAKALWSFCICFGRPGNLVSLLRTEPPV